MGCAKLLLPVGNQTVIANLLECLQHEVIADRCVTVRADDESLKEEVEKHGGTAVRPDYDPPDMKASVLCVLDWIEERFHPAENDAWLLIPADNPEVNPSVLQQVVSTWSEQPEKIIVPVHQGRRGHPTLFPWTFKADILQIPDDAGINWLLQHYQQDVLELPVAEHGILTDLDRPEDYEAWIRTRRSDFEI